MLTETAGTFHREVAAEERPYKPFSNFVPSTTTAAEKAVLAYTIKVLREKGGGLEGGAMDVLACETEPGVGGNSMQGPGVGAVRGVPEEAESAARDDGGMRRPLFARLASMASPRRRRAARERRSRLEKRRSTPPSPSSATWL